jgi:hypothetical protein
MRLQKVNAKLLKYPNYIEFFKMIEVNSDFGKHEYNKAKWMFDVHARLKVKNKWQAIRTELLRHF